MINNIFSSNVSYSSKSQPKNVTEKKANLEEASQNQKSQQTSKSNQGVEVKISERDSRKELNAIITKSEQQTKNFQKLITSIFSKQADKATLINYGQSGSLKHFYESLIVDAETIAKAKKDISEDGYYGVEQTSERITSFAKAIAGDDPKKIAQMRDAVEKGFKQAEKMWGDELPEISKQTYDKVMETFDSWQ